jgi:hypothetical protein
LNQNSSKILHIVDENNGLAKAVFESAEKAAAPPQG